MILKKIEQQNLNIGIVGIGYVGIKLVLAFSKRNNKVFCFEKDKKKINSLKKFKSPFSYIKNSEIKKASNHLILSYNFKNISRCDAIIICLPTPLKKGKPDLSHLKECWSNIKPFVKKGQIIILESTTYPGCTEDIFYHDLNKKFIIDENFFLCYSPERQNPGDDKFDFKNTPKVVSGIGKNSLTICKNLYSLIVKKIYCAKNIRVAEASKLLENIYRSINIALINELNIACHSLNLNIYDIINLASSKPFGFSKFIPGPGTGGHCIPIDPIYFSWMSKKRGVDVKFIKLSARINTFRTKWIISNIIKILKKNNKKKVLLLGLAYKKNIEDTRESAPIKIFENLKKNKKLIINYYDPFVKNSLFVINKKKTIFKSIKYNLNTFKKYEVLILATDHDKFDYKKILDSQKIIIDLRGKFINERSNKNIYNL